MICHFVECSGKVPQRHLTENQLAMNILPEALEEKRCVGMIRTRELRSNKDVKVSVCAGRMSALSKTGTFYLLKSLGLESCLALDILA